MTIPTDALKTPKTSSIERIPQLSSMRVLACVGIVVLHTVFAANEYFAETLSQTADMVSRMVENNMMWAVPAFVMVTGTLQLDPRRQLTLRKLYGRYILRILIALVACCLLFRIFDMIMDGEPFTAAGLLRAFVELVTARCWGHLWYLYLLIGLYILLPFYRMIAEGASDRLLWLFCGIWFLFLSIFPMIESFGITLGLYLSDSIIYPLYLFLGYMICFGRITVDRRTGLLLLIGSTVVILLLDYMKYGMMMEIPSAFFGYASPFVILQSMGVFALVCKGRPVRDSVSRWLRLADDCSFGIYLIHMVFIRLLFRYMGWNPYDSLPVLGMAAVILGNFLLSMAIVWALKKIPGVRWVL